MKFTLKIKPSINPRTRHKIEDVLQAEGYKVIGGGQTVKVPLVGSFSDISFERDDPRDKV